MVIELETFKAKKPKDKKIDTTKQEDFEGLLKYHGGQTAAEIKYDGYGIIIDTRNKNVDIRSLTLSEWDTKCLPEIDFTKLPSGLYVGELVGTHTHNGFSSLDEFGAVKGRSLVSYDNRIYGAAEQHPLHVRLYDIVEMENELIGKKPNYEVRPILEDICQGENIRPTSRTIISDAAELLDVTNEVFLQGKEGFVIKKLDGTYLNHLNGTSRNSDWFKIKKYLTVDCVVLGLYQTEDRLKQGFACSNALVGSYNANTDMFETLTKLTITNPDMAEEFADRLEGSLDYSWSKDQPYFWQNKGIAPKFDSSVAYSPSLLRGVPANKVPYMFVQNPGENSFVVEVGAMDVTSPKKTVHSCGLADGRPHSLRQPTFVRYREDKTPYMVTTTEQLHSV